MKNQEYYVTLKLKIQSDPVQEEDLIAKEEIDERFKKEFDCIFNEDELNVTEFKSKLKVKEIIDKN